MRSANIRFKKILLSVGSGPRLLPLPNEETDFLSHLNYGMVENNKYVEAASEQVDDLPLR